MDMKYYWLQDKVRRKKMMYIGAQVKTILEIIIPHTIQHNITKISALRHYIKLTA
jgi:hypothetical protein